MSVRLSARPMEQLGFYFTDFHEILYLRVFFENLSRKFKFHKNLTIITRTLHEEICALYVAEFFLKLELFETYCREDKNTFCV
jgi:hypothetical protein